MAIIKVKTGGVDSTTNLGRRNLVMNGDMSVAQRGTSTTTTSGNYVISPDRFRCYTGNYSTSPITASQSTDSPDGFSNSLKYNFDSADATPSHEHSIYYSIEGQDLQHLQKGTANSKSLTLSFWCKASLSGTYIAELMDNDNSNRHINKSYTISSANTWEYKTITFEGDTVGTLDNDTGNSLSVIFWVAANSSNSSGTLQTSWGSLTQANRAVGQTNLGATVNNAFYITGLQLEVGDTATQFENRSYGEELRACQRYYYQAGDGLPFGSAQSGSGANAYLWCYTFRHPVQMRATPTVSLISGASVYFVGGIGVTVGTPTGDLGTVATSSMSLPTVNVTDTAIHRLGLSGFAFTRAMGYGGTANFIHVDAEF